MQLASWTFLLMFLTYTVRGYDDDDSILERLAEEMEETRHQPHQQHGGGGSSRGRTPVLSAVSPAAAPPDPDLAPWTEDDYEATATRPSLRRGTGVGRLGGGGGGRRGGGRGGKQTPGSGRQSSSPRAAPAAAAEPKRASTSSSRTPHHVFPSDSAADNRHAQQRRRKTSLVQLNGSRGLVAQSVCPSQTQWRQLTRARDINNTFVEVFQPSSGDDERAPGDTARRSQWFYTVSCVNQAFQEKRPCQDCCIGIDDTRYTSSCEQKQSYVMAYVRRPWQTKFHWNLISVNSSCNCAITSIHNDL